MMFLPVILDQAQDSGTGITCSDGMTKCWRSLDLRVVLSSLNSIASKSLFSTNKADRTVTSFKAAPLMDTSKTTLIGGSSWSVCMSMKEVAGMALRKNVPLNESKINIKYVQFKSDNIALIQLFWERPKVVISIQQIIKSIHNLI